MFFLGLSNQLTANKIFLTVFKAHPPQPFSSMAFTIDGTKMC
jgi:hypothetical protein